MAAVLSFVAADALDTSSSPVLAPLTALLVVHLTMYETLANGRERIVSVVAGVLVALLFASITGLNWWSLALVVAVSLVLGRLLRLGPHLPEVPISAMLVLAVGGAEPVALGRVVETLVGAVVGVLVNLVNSPPLYIQPASDAIDELAERMASFCDDLAAALRMEWSRQTAARQLSRARLLGQDVARADRHLATAEESARLNPRGRQARDVQPRLRSTLTALEHVQVGLRSLSRVLLDRTFFVPEDQADRAHAPETRAALAEVLTVVATALRRTCRWTWQRSTPAPGRRATASRPVPRWPPRTPTAWARCSPTSASVVSTPGSGSSTPGAVPGSRRLRPASPGRASTRRRPCSRSRAPGRRPTHDGHAGGFPGASRPSGRWGFLMSRGHRSPARHRAAPPP